MSSANVIPSAPSYSMGAEVPSENAETQTLYPALPTFSSQPPDNFRLQKANEVLKYLSDEAEHYRIVAKKYKRAKTGINFATFACGGISGVLSAGSVAAAATGIGIPASIPIGGVAAVFGCGAAALTGVYKKLEPKLLKHCKIMTLAMSKFDSVNRILSKSLVDGKITDAEFQNVMNEKEGYRIKKEIFRKGTLPKGSKKQSSTDIEQLREQIR